MRRLFVPFIVVAPLLASCTASEPQAVLAVAAAPEPPGPAMPAPAYVAPEYSGPRLPGRWGIYVDAANVPASYRSDNAACGDRTYDIPADAVVRDAVMQTSASAFDMARLLASPPRNGNLGGLNWALAIRVTRADGGLDWQAASVRPVARADLKAEITVFDSRGRTIRTMTESAAALSDDGPGGCDGGEALMAKAWQRASQALMNEIVPELGTN